MSSRVSERANIRSERARKRTNERMSEISVQWAREWVSELANICSEWASERTFVRSARTKRATRRKRMNEGISEWNLGAPLRPLTPKFPTSYQCVIFCLRMRLMKRMIYERLQFFPIFEISQLSAHNFLQGIWICNQNCKRYHFKNLTTLWVSYNWREICGGSPKSERRETFWTLPLMQSGGDRLSTQLVTMIVQNV